MDRQSFDFVYFNFHRTSAHSYLTQWDSGYLTSLAAGDSSSDSEDAYQTFPARGSITEDKQSWPKMVGSIGSNHQEINLRFGKLRKSKLPTKFAISDIQPISSKLSDCQETLSTGTGNSNGDEQSELPSLADQINALVKDKLKNDKYFRIDDATKKEKSNFGNVVEAAGATYSFDSIKPLVIKKDFAKLCMSEKDVSVSFQAYIETCSEEEIQQICEWVSLNLASIITHQFGNYIVQKLIKRSASCLKNVVDYCQDKFLDLASNEYSSRVMQTLVEINPEFRSFALKCFKADLTKYAQSISAVFLLSVAIRCSKKDSEFEFIRDALLRNPKKWLVNKYFKRIIVSYLQNCSGKSLDLVFRGLQIESRLFKYLDDKYSCYMLLMFIERHHELAKSMILKRIQSDLKGLLSTKFFRFFFSKILKCAEPQFLQSMSEELFTKSQQANFEKQFSMDSFYFFAFMVANSTADPCSPDLLKFADQYAGQLNLPLSAIRNIIQH